MKITCDKAALIGVLQAVGQVLPSKTTIDILKNIYVSCRSGVATFVASDTEITMINEIDCDVDVEGKALIPPRVMAILKELVGPCVTLELVTQEASKNLHIMSGFSEFTLATSSPDDYPEVSAIKGGVRFSIGGNTLKQMITRTAFATDTESTRYALGGINFDIEPDKLHMVATDSRRLCEARTPITISKDDIPAVGPVVPVKAMLALARTATAADVQVIITDNEVGFEYGRAKLVSKTVQGRFPDWKRVIPTTFETVVPIVVGPLASAVRQAMITTNEESRGTLFTFLNGMLRLSSGAADIGNAKVEVVCTYALPSPIVAKLDGKYLMDLLKTLDPGEVVHVGLNGDDYPVSFTLGDGTLNYVQMPIAQS